MALLSVVATTQVCHSHDEAPGLGYSLLNSGQASIQSTQPTGLPPTSAVNCPLCVAMHSALPVTHHLTQVALLRFDPAIPAPISVDRRLLWQSDRTSRPPPTAPPLA